MKLRRALAHTGSHLNQTFIDCSIAVRAHTWWGFSLARFGEDRIAMSPAGPPAQSACPAQLLVPLSAVEELIPDAL
jgi:hypothetical protein